MGSRTTFNKLREKRMLSEIRFKFHRLNVNTFT